MIERTVIVLAISVILLFIIVIKWAFELWENSEDIKTLAENIKEDKKRLRINEIIKEYWLEQWKHWYWIWALTYKWIYVWSINSDIEQISNTLRHIRIWEEIKNNK